MDFKIPKRIKTNQEFELSSRLFAPNEVAERLYKANYEVYEGTFLVKENGKIYKKPVWLTFTAKKEYGRGHYSVQYKEDIYVIKMDSSEFRFNDRNALPFSKPALSGYSTTIVEVKAPTTEKELDKLEASITLLGVFNKEENSGKLYDTLMDINNGFQTLHENIMSAELMRMMQTGEIVMQNINEYYEKRNKTLVQLGEILSTLPVQPKHDEEEEEEEED